MLVIPVTEKTSWSNPPWLTILLILANCFVFFAFQSGEGKQMLKVTEYYTFSGLAKIEAPRYEDYLKQQGKTKELKEYKESLDFYGDEAIYWSIAADKGFSDKLLNDEIITPDQKIYSRWKADRNKLAAMVSEIFTYKYGHRPDRFNIYTPFTYMFLHGGVMHLVGNMIFLWLVGSILELSCNRAAYLGGYLVTGYFSAVFFGWIYHNSSLPLVGASGAISGLMGAYTVIYGLGKVKIFYSLGFFFSYAKIPALLLLPFWIGKELFQLSFGGPSNVAYVGHLGGLTSGAALGFLQLKLVGAVQEEEFKDDVEHKSAALKEKAMAKLADLDLDGARPIFAEIIEKEPRNLLALKQLYKIDKNHPGAVDFPKTAARLLTHLIRRSVDYQELLETYRQYCRLTKAALPKELYATLCLKFAANGQFSEAGRIANFLLKKHPAFPGIPGCLLCLAKALEQNGHGEQGANCLKIICRNYPDSAESQAARQLLQG